MALAEAATANAVSTFLPFVLQIFLIATSALDAARTTDRKIKWMTYTNKAFKGFIPRRTVILSITYFFTEIGISIFRTWGLLGFSKLPPVRIQLLASYYFNAFAVPLVALATVSRLARRLNRTSSLNAAEFSKASGILEAKTVHGQVLKVFYADVASKADVLLDLQRIQLAQCFEAKREENSRDFGENLRENLTPAEVFAAGLIRPGLKNEEYHPPTFLKLMRNITQQKGIQRVRLISQLAIIVAASVCVQAGLRWKAKVHVPGETMLGNWGANIWIICPVVVGLFYERFAPEIASGQGKQFTIVFFWVLLQIVILFCPIEVFIYGNLPGNLLYFQILARLTAASCLFETLVSEAWIATQMIEIEQFAVPSYLELEVFLKRGEEREEA